MAVTADAISTPVPSDDSGLARAMLLFLVPQTIGIALQLISSTITTVYFGRLMGASALAVASGFFPIFFLLVSFLVGLFSGGVVLVGQAHGAGDTAGVRAVTGTTLCVGGMLSILVAGAGYLLAGKILGVIGTPPDILADAIAYAGTMFLVLPVLVILFAYMVLLRGTGDAYTPLWAMIGWIALGLILTPALIQGWFGLPRLGVLSAPYGNLVAAVATLVTLLLYLRRQHHPMAPDRAFFAALRFDGNIILRLLRIGVPAGVQVAMVALSEIVVVSLVNAFGSHATAAYGVFNQVISYVQAPTQAAAVAASVFGAQVIGAGHAARLGSVTRIAVLLTLGAGTIAIGAVYLLSAEILGWFIADPEPQAIAQRALIATLWSYLLVAVAGVLGAVMRAAGDVLYPTTVSIIAVWMVQLPTAYFSAARMGIDGVWLGYPAAFTFVLVAQLAYYGLVWRHRKHARLLEPAATN
jgi:MATE family, multidrug efflux pump